MSALKNQIVSYDQIDFDGIVTALKNKGYRVERSRVSRFGEPVNIIELKDLDEKFELRFNPQYGGTVDVIRYPTGTVILTDKRTNKTLIEGITTDYVRTQNRMVSLIKEGLIYKNHPTDQGWREFARNRLNDYENVYLKDRPNAFKYYMSIAQKEVDEESKIPKTPDAIKRKYGGNKFHLHGTPFTSHKAAMEVGLKKEGEGHVCFIEPFGSKFTLYVSEMKVRPGDKNPYPLKPAPRQHSSAKKAAYVTAYGERHKAHKKTQADKRAIHEQAVRETQDRGLIFGHTWDDIQSMQQGKRPPRPQPTTPIPPRKTPGATVKTDTMLRQESIKEQADMIFETFAAPRPGRVDPVGMQKTVTRNGVMATADIDTRYVRNNVVYASVEVVDDNDRRTAYKAIPIISHKAIRDALSKDMSYRGPSNAKAVYEGVLETALNSHFKKYPAPKKPAPRQHPQAKKAAYVAAYGKRHKAYERDVASKDIFGMTPRQQREYTRAMEKPMNGEKIESEEDYWLHQPESEYEQTLAKSKATHKPRAPARKKPAPKKAAPKRKPAAKKPPAAKRKSSTRTTRRAPVKKPAPKATGKPRVLKASKTQTGKSDKKRDAARKAMPPGKRESATGRVYYEYRKNRSDVRGRKT